MRVRMITGLVLVLLAACGGTEPPACPDVTTERFAGCREDRGCVLFCGHFGPQGDARCYCVPRGGLWNENP
jgi:hypothetical protein